MDMAPRALRRGGVGMRAIRMYIVGMTVDLRVVLGDAAHGALA